MAQIKSGDVNPVDVTKLIDKGLPKSWKCPHCGKRNKMDEFADYDWCNYWEDVGVQFTDFCSRGEYRNEE